MKRGALSARELVESCLERIQARENTIHAWVEVYEKEATDAAEQCDREFRNGNWLGDLHGVPIGVKDIIDAKGMWTRAGCEVYPARISTSDAEGVKRLRSAGAIILGKTETTPFANSDPTITCNPWNPEHTPGGSSSGSGAAVADRMCLAALGSQTGGSLLRPAAYNGIVGFKPTYGQVSLAGVVPVSWGLDMIGPHTRSVEDAGLMCRLMRTERPVPFLPMPTAVEAINANFHGSTPRLGFMEDFLKSETSSEYIDHITSIRDLFTQAGATIIDLSLPKSFDSVKSAHRTIFDTEQACYHQALFSAHKDHYPPNLKTRIEAGMTISGRQYVDAIRKRMMFQSEMVETLSSMDAAFMNASLTTAPRGLSSTGSPAANVPWSFSGFPAVSLPSGLDARGLPFGVQIVGLPGADVLLTSVSIWCEQVLAFHYSPTD